MKKHEIVARLLEHKYVAVIRMDETRALDAIHEIIAGGVKFIEVTLTMKGALTMIHELSNTYAEDVYIGAGTVLDATSAVLAINNGASFIVGPMFDAEIARVCNLYQVPYIPGVSNPKDIYEALSAGSEILKLFPASQFQDNAAQEFKGPFPQAHFMISGKVDLESAPRWLSQGASVVCLGSILVRDAAKIQAVTRAFIEQTEVAV